MNSSSNPGKSSPTYAEQFLSDLLNLDLGRDADWRKFWKKFAGPVAQAWMVWSWPVRSRTATTGLSESQADSISDESFRNHVKQFRRDLQHAWRQPTPHERMLVVMLVIARQLYLASLAEKEIKDPVMVYRLIFDEALPELPSAPFTDPFVDVLVHALRFVDRMRVCQNPKCQTTPYFIARRRTQKYCSDLCALPAQREFKSVWWREHGAAWRAKQKARKPRGKRKKKRGK